MSGPVAELQTLLGPTAVFINWPLGEKGLKGVRWGHLRLPHMTPDYLKRLTGNIGVALGKPSDGLCAVDLDHEPIVAPFLAANPQLAGTLQTHGARGRVFWIRIAG